MPTKQSPCQTPGFSSLRGSLTFAASRIIAFPHVFSAAKLRKPLSVTPTFQNLGPYFQWLTDIHPRIPEFPPLSSKAGQAQTAHPVDNPLVPPGRKRGHGACNPADIVDRSIDDFGIEPRRRFARAHDAEADLAQFATSGENVIVPLVDKPFVVEDVVEIGRAHV